MLTRSNKRETAVHCYDPALSALVMLVSRNVFHVVSALQSFAFIIFYVFFRVVIGRYLSSNSVFFLNVQNVEQKNSLQEIKIQQQQQQQHFLFHSIIYKK